MDVESSLSRASHYLMGIYHAAFSYIGLVYSILKQIVTVLLPKSKSVECRHEHGCAEDFKYLDRILVEKCEDLEPYILKQRGIAFNKKVKSSDINFEIYTNGYINGLRTLHTVQNCFLKKDDRVYIRSDVGAGVLSLHQIGTIAFMNFGPSLVVDWNVMYAQCHVEMSFNAKDGGNVIIHDLSLELFYSKLYVTGLGPLNIICKWIYDSLFFVFEYFITKATEHIVKKQLEDKLKNFNFPLDNAELRVGLQSLECQNTSSGVVKTPAITFELLENTSCRMEGSSSDEVSDSDGNISKSPKYHMLSEDTNASTDENEDSESKNTKPIKRESECLLVESPETSGDESNVDNEINKSNEVLNYFNAPVESTFVNTDKIFKTLECAAKEELGETKIIENLDESKEKARTNSKDLLIKTEKLVTPEGINNFCDVNTEVSSISDALDVHRVKLIDKTLDSHENKDQAFSETRKDSNKNLESNVKLSSTNQTNSVFASDLNADTAEVNAAIALLLCGTAFVHKYEMNDKKLEVIQEDSLEAKNGVTTQKVQESNSIQSNSESSKAESISNGTKIKECSNDHRDCLVINDSEKVAVGCLESFEVEQSVACCSKSSERDHKHCAADCLKSAEAETVRSTTEYLKSNKVELEQSTAKSLEFIEAESEQTTECMETIEADLENSTAQCFKSIEAGKSTTEFLDSIEAEQSTAECLESIEAEPEKSTAECLKSVEAEQSTAECLESIEAEQSTAECLESIEAEQSTAEYLESIEAEPEKSTAECLESIEAGKSTTELLDSIEAEQSTAECLESIEAEPEKNTAECFKSVEAEQSTAECLKSIEAEQSTAECFESIKAKHIKNTAECLESIEGEQSARECLEFVRSKPEQGTAKCLESVKTEHEQNAFISSKSNNEFKLILANFAENVDTSVACLEIGISKQDLTQCEETGEIELVVELCEKTGKAKLDIALCEGAVEVTPDVSSSEAIIKGELDFFPCEGPNEVKPDAFSCKETEKFNQNVALLAKTEIEESGTPLFDQTEVKMSLEPCEKNEEAKQCVAPEEERNTKSNVACVNTTVVQYVTCDLKTISSFTTENTMDEVGKAAHLREETCQTMTLPAACDETGETKMIFTDCTRTDEIKIISDDCKAKGEIEIFAACSLSAEKVIEDEIVQNKDTRQRSQGRYRYDDVNLKSDDGKEETGPKETEKKVEASKQSTGKRRGNRQSRYRKR